MFEVQISNCCTPQSTSQLNAIHSIRRGGCSTWLSKGWDDSRAASGRFSLLLFPLKYLCCRWKFSCSFYASFQPYSFFISKVPLKFPGSSLICLMATFLFSLTGLGPMLPGRFCVLDVCTHCARLYSHPKSSGSAGHLPRVSHAGTPTNAIQGSLALSPVLHEGRTDSKPLLHIFSGGQRWISADERKKGASFLLHLSGLSS